jgi:subtilase family serine protease
LSLLNRAPRSGFIRAHPRHPRSKTAFVIVARPRHNRRRIPGTGWTTPEQTGKRIFYCLSNASLVSAPDFVVTSIALAPGLPVAGGKVTATVTVRNQGNVSGKAGYLYVWMDKPAAGAIGDRCDKSAVISTLKPGQSKTMKLALTAPDARGSFTLRAFVDAKNGVTEADESNNQETHTYATGLPDFEILAVRISPEIPVAGKTFTAYVTVTNSGEVTGNAGYLDLWADSSALPATPVPGAKTKGNKYKTVGILQPGQQKILTVTGLKTPPATAAPVLGILIDSRAKTQELDEANNWFEFDY